MLAAGLLALFVCALFYPGFMTTDSFAQFAQARAGVFNDWHPPVMGLLWRGFHLVVPGPFGMLLLHSVLFASGLGLLCFVALPDRATALAGIVGIGLFPSVLPFIGVLWKDVGMAAAFLLASALLLFAGTRKSWGAWLAALAFLFFGVLLRHNGIAAVLPLAIWAGWILQQLRGKKIGRGAGASAGFGFCATLVLFLLAGALNSRLTEGRSLYPLQQILLRDLATLSARSGELLAPDYVRAREPGLKPADFSGKDIHDLSMPIATNDLEFQQLKKSWLQAVERYPLDYLSTRLVHYGRLLGLDGPHFPIMIGNDPAGNEAQLVGFDWKPYEWRQSRWRLLVIGRYYDLRNTFLYRPWLYLALTLLVIGLCAFRYRRNLVPVLAIGASGLFYSLAYIFATTDYDVRFHWWTIVAALAVIPILLRPCGPETART